MFDSTGQHDVYSSIASASTCSTQGEEQAGIKGYPSASLSCGATLAKVGGDIYRYHAEKKAPTQKYS